MSDTISDDMLTAIRSYDGPVTVCPPGSFGDDDVMRMLDRILHHHTPRARAVPKKRDASRNANMWRVKEALEDGLTIPETAERVGIKVAYVYQLTSMLRRLGEAPRKPRDTTIAEGILRLADGVLSSADLAVALKTTSRTISVTASRLRAQGHIVPMPRRGWQGRK